MGTIEEALEFARNLFSHEASGHDFHHTYRVYRVAMNLARQEKADEGIVALASILHDVDDYKLFAGPQGSTKNAEDFLIAHKIDPDRIQTILEIIQTLSYKGTDTIACESLEGKIVQDADRLDAIGAIGIARAFAFGGNKRRVMHDPAILPNLSMNQAEYTANRGTTINHFHEKLLLLKDRMNTESAKKIAERRHRFMEDFLSEFQNEWDASDFFFDHES